jgi:hypothetical protein
MTRRLLYNPQVLPTVPRLSPPLEEFLPTSHSLSTTWCLLYDSPSSLRLAVFLCLSLPIRLGLHAERLSQTISRFPTPITLPTSL